MRSSALNQNVLVVSLEQTAQAFGCYGGVSKGPLSTFHNALAAKPCLAAAIPLFCMQ